MFIIYSHIILLYSPPPHSHPKTLIRMFFFTIDNDPYDSRYCCSHDQRATVQKWIPIVASSPTRNEEFFFSFRSATTNKSDYAKSTVVNNTKEKIVFRKNFVGIRIIGFKKYFTPRPVTTRSRTKQCSFLKMNQINYYIPK